MENTDRWGNQMEGGMHTVARKFFSGMALAIALVVAGGVVLRGQNAPNPSPAPQVAPEPPEPPDPPDPPGPPDPPDSSELFLLNDGSAHLGVTLGDVTTEKAQELKLPAVAGAIVNGVQKDSAAAKAGIEKGDAIIEFDGVRVRSSAELRRLIRETPTGRTVEMKIVRDGKTRVLNAKLEATNNQWTLNMPEVHIPPIHVPEVHVPPMDLYEFGDRHFEFGNHRAMLGISADELTPQLAQYFGVKQGKGVLISEVTTGGAADKAGLKAGDVIVQVDGKSISGMEDLRAALNDKFTEDRRKVSLTIVRDRHEQTVNAELTRSQSMEKRTSDAAAQTLAQSLAQVKKAQADPQRAQLRALADQQRALVRAEVLKQQAQEKAQWQRQLQEQMLALKDQLKQLQNLHVTVRQNGEI
jgi:membrane-associated protease RseP (regulator of RpoE activity)